ncbi:MAG: FMN-binding glutamate synthase family protein [Candidatus Cloacimonetes bacterium]|nr:FMN-binding glutamate synthase family protein [Candidatus Cloacimonadota bacterium]MCK9515605.1 glutamate synthase-related protein [Ottowia sp.]
MYKQTIRFSTMAFCTAGLLVCLLLLARGGGVWLALLTLLFGLLVLLGVYDLLQIRHTILRNYPILGHLRYILEFIRPEIRQYFVEGDQEAEPFSRKQRAVVYQRAKGVADVRPFGTQLNVSARGYEWINHSMHTTQIASHDFRLWIGGRPGAPNAGVSACTRPYNASIFNISAMSFGALSANAIMAMNWGAQIGSFAQDTGEGGISRYHRRHGGDLIWEIGSGYFGCRKDDGSFNPERFAQQAADPQVKMIEIKISQGAKPGHGGILPAAKVTAEIAATRHVPVGVDCVSPSSHSAFSTPLELMQFIARLRELSGGKPVGFKLCIGHLWEWFAIVKAMLQTDITPDFIVVDGAEGGTGAAPVELTDHVGAPVQESLRLVNNTLVGVGLRERVKIGAAGKIITAFDMARMFALGADWVNAGRGYMMSVGCVQAQICHTGLCPTGVTTQDPVRQRALVVTDKAPRVAQYHANTLHALKELLQAAGLTHPDELTPFHIVRRIGDDRIRLLSAIFPSVPARGIVDDLDHQQNVYRLYWPLADAASFAPAMAMAGEAPQQIDANLPQRAGALRSPAAIARELGHPAHVRPAPISDVVPGSALQSAPTSPTQVPETWGGSDDSADDAPQARAGQATEITFSDD